MKQKDDRTEAFLTYVTDHITQLQDQTGQIRKAANLIVQARKSGGQFYAFGSGHSHILVEEMYARAGGLAFIRPIFATELMALDFPTKSTWIERLEGYAKGLLDIYDVQDGDCLLVVSNSGRNAVPVEMALEAKARGASVIALTSLDMARKQPSRHSSKKLLCDLADVVIDNHVPAGDALYDVNGTATGALSEILGCTLVQMLTVEIIHCLQEEGMEVPVFVSSNVDGGDQQNAALFETFYGYRKNFR